MTKFMFVTFLFRMLFNQCSSSYWGVVEVMMVSYVDRTTLYFVVRFYIHCHLTVDAALFLYISMGCVFFCWNIEEIKFLFNDTFIE